MRYVVKKKNKVFDVINLEYPIKGYKFNSKSEDVKSITLVDSKLITKVVDIKVNTMLNRLLMIVNDAFNSDDNPTGVTIALDEIRMVKNAIYNKYNKLLDDRKKELYLRKISLLEQEMYDKMVIYQLDNYKTSNKSR